MCRESKRADKIHNSWSNKGVIKFKRTMNKRPMPVGHDYEVKAFNPFFIFKKSDGTSLRDTICFIKYQH